MGMKLFDSSGNTIWSLNDTVISMDFTGTDYNTKAKCNAVGMTFSDYNTPYPDKIYTDHDGTWSHVESSGWLPASTTDLKGPGIMFRLPRAADLDIQFTLTYTPSAAAQRILISSGVCTSSGNNSMVHRAIDNSASTELGVQAYTNDGDDTFTNFLTGTAQSGTGDRLMRFKIINGCYSSWDFQASSFTNYNGHQSSTCSYTADYFWLTFYKFTGYTFGTPVYLKDFQVSIL